MAVCLLLAAAGSGSRFGGPVCKQLLELAGRPVLLRSLDAFAGLVDHAVIAVSAAVRAELTALLAHESFPFPVELVDGGASRFLSVFQALRASPASCDRILVHDAARPLVPRSCIEACLRALDQHPAAVVAEPCPATVKRAGPDGCVVATVPRSDLWLAQTPQGFHRDLGLAAFAAAASRADEFSDDVQVLEVAGHAVALVRGDPCNLKLTSPGDLALAEALLCRAKPG